MEAASELVGRVDSEAVQSGEKNGSKARRTRVRAARACNACHSRKVRCDITSRGPPCTNCTAYAVDCEPHVPKTRVWSKRKRVRACMVRAPPSLPDGTDDGAHSSSPESSLNDRDGSVPTGIFQDLLPSSYESPSPSPRRRSPARDSWFSLLSQELHDSMPRFEYLGESTGLFLLQDEYDDMDIHHPLSYGSSSLVRRLGPYQIADLMRRGAFTIPGKPLRDELVSEFFRWVAPNLPIVNKKFFLYQYETWQRGSRPSLLLLQAMFLSASKVSTSPLLLRAIGSNLAASAIFYQRAKALYDADYEPDRVIVLQSLLLMGLHCEDPRGVGTTFYWSRIAIAVAQSIGLHRSVTTSNLSLPEKRLYKRIWWTLVVRDRLTSVCLGRPMGIDLEDCDVEMLEESDFLDEDEHASSPEVVSPGQLHAKFAVQHLKLSKIMGQIFSAYYSTSSRPEAQTHLEYDRRLTAWLQQRPPELIWHKTAREYWASVLHLHYCTAICLLHKAHMSTRPDMTLSEVHLSRGAAYDAADSITDIIEGLISNGELRYCPPFILHSLYSALLIHAHRITKGNGHELFPMRSGAEVCLKACQELSGSWTAASLTYGVFSHLLSSKLRWEGSSTQSDVSFETPDGLSLTGVDPTLDRFDAFGL